jgi:hypothetical protein
VARTHNTKSTSPIPSAENSVVEYPISNIGPAPNCSSSIL